MKNIEFCKKLFQRLLDADDQIDKFIIMDFFSLKTIQLLEDYDVNIAEKYSQLFKEFEEDCTKFKKLKEIQMYFFSLANLLDNKYFFLENTNKKERTDNIYDYVKNLKEIIK
tara:strand:+ start:860 stop:1195 length:336 start_codon:yes stop_codon:yes gene_type:complete